MNNFAKSKNICRICLMENNEEIQCVFDTIGSSTGEPVKFSEMIMTCAKVEIIAGDELPDQICSTCAQNTIKLYLFKIKCEESDSILRSSLQEVSFIVIDKIEVNEENIFDKLESEIKKENVEPSDVLNVDYSGGDCAQQVEDNNLPERIIYKDYNAYTLPKYCDEPFNNFNSSITTDSTLSNEEEFECHDDDLKYVRKCTVEYVTESNSLAKRNSRKNLHECDNCKRKFSQSVSLAKHKCIKQRHHHANKKKKNASSAEKFYKCDLCEKKYKRSKSLIAHRRTHTGEKPYKCDDCENKFHKLELLNTHKRMHTGEKPYTCDICNKKFSGSSALVYHKRTHTGEKPYKCDVCERKFSESRQLIIHKRLHTGEKPYECDVCKHAFTQARSLVIHKRTHTGEKPYECNICGEKFHRSSALIYHKNAQCEKAAKPYKCDVCEKKFSQKSSILRHKRRAHTTDDGGGLKNNDKKRKNTKNAIFGKRNSNN